MADQATLGKRLREARENCGMSQEEAAQALGLPRTAIVQIEAGNRSVSTIELSEFARIYQCPVTQFLAAEETVEEDYLVAIHRLSPECKDMGPIKKEVSQAVEICREGVHLESMLKRKPRVGPPAYDLPAPRNPYEAIEQAELVAEEERNRLNLGSSPIPDMADLISSQGIWASGVRFPDEMSGLFLHQAMLGLVILVNYNHPRGRKRFSYAHEYGHALFDRKRAMTITSKSNSAQLVEKRANAFAASFLIPKAGVELFLVAIDKGAASRKNFVVYDVATEEKIEAESRTLASMQQLSFQDVALLAAHFGVSFQVGAYRLSDLGYLNRDELAKLLEKQDAAQQYLRLIGKLDDVAGKPRSHDRELVSQIIPLAVEAYRRDEISKGRLLELSKKLNVKGAELAALE